LRGATSDHILSPMVTRHPTMPDRRHTRPTRQVHWSKLTADEVAPGDVLAWGTVLAKAWGGPVGIEAWRLVIEGQIKPLWLVKGEVVHRRARARREPAQVAGVVGSRPRR
jgi:hypothetical protein